MKKYIYGCAFYSHFVEEVKIKDETPSLVFLDLPSIKFSSEIGLTLDHDMDKVVATTNNSNLDIVITEQGVFFRYLVEGAQGGRAYRKVKNRGLRHCSTMRRQIGEYRRKRSFETYSPSNKRVYLEKASLMYEICLTNEPKHKDTFCTVHKDDSRLQNIDWDNKVTCEIENMWEFETEIHKSKLWQKRLKEMIECEKLEISKN